MTLSYQEYQETRHFRALDGLRAISILLVLILHTNSRMWGSVNGGLGVFIFFVISGFLITTLALREEGTRGSVSLRAFYVRRACRILPLYYLVLLFYVAAVIGVNYHGHRQLLLIGLPYYLTYMNEFVPELDSMPFAHSWSLGVEEKFYLVWPVLMFVVLRGRPRLRFLGTAALIVLPPVLAFLGLPFGAERYGLPLYYSYEAILVGCLLSLALHNRTVYTGVARLASGIPAVATLALFLAVHVSVGSKAWVSFLYPFCVALAMVPILLGELPWTRWLGTKPMVFIGTRSYGIYLVHQICLSVTAAIVGLVPGIVFDEARIPVGSYGSAATFLTLVLAFASSLAVASLLNLAVEQPFIEFGRRRTRALTGREPVAPARRDETAPAHTGSLSTSSS